MPYISFYSIHPLFNILKRVDIGETEVSLCIFAKVDAGSHSHLRLFHNFKSAFKKSLKSLLVLATTPKATVVMGILPLDKKTGIAKGNGAWSLHGLLDRQAA
jgi:hypothetical protein